MKYIIICGSMAFKDEMISVKEELENRGYLVELPVECMEGKPKEIASRAHFNRVIDDKTDAILVINSLKKGKANYIGPNTFAEIAFAFHFNKKIFLLHDIYEPFQDELVGWGCIPLHQNLDNIK